MNEKHTIMVNLNHLCDMSKKGTILCPSPEMR